MSERVWQTLYVSMDGYKKGKNHHRNPMMPNPVKLSQLPEYSKTENVGLGKSVKEKYYAIT